MAKMTKREEETAAWNHEEARRAASEDNTMAKARKSVNTMLEVAKTLSPVDLSHKGPDDRVKELQALRLQIEKKKPSAGYDPKQQLMYIDHEIARLSGK